MIRIRQLSALLLLVPAAFAQVQVNSPAEPAVTGMSVSGENREVRIEVKATAPVPPASVSRVYEDRLVLDLPGVALGRLPQRIVIRKNGVRAVRIWQQRPNPPLTRILIELDRSVGYALSAEQNTIVLRLSSDLPRPDQQTSPAGAQRASRQEGARPAGRGSPAARAADALVGVFRRGGESESSRDAVAPPEQAAAPKTAVAEPPRAAQPEKSRPDPSSEPGPIETAKTAAATPAKKPEQPAGPPTLHVPPESSTARSDVLAGSAPQPGSSALPEGPVPAAPSDANALPAPTPEAPATAVPSSGVAQAQEAPADFVPATIRTIFQVKHVQQDTAYLDGGRSSGLSEGMTLLIKDKVAADGTAGGGATIAELVIVGVAETSAVTEIRKPTREVVRGDMAYLSSRDTQALVTQRTIGATRKYPAVISFTESDLLDEEARAEVPRPPLPSVNRARGRVGLDYTGTVNHDLSGGRNSNLGLVFRADVTRIGGSYWNLSGYWRGRLTSYTSSSEQQTLQDLINRTYHLELSYQNPGSPWVAGIGRLYLPWASSLNTIDGGYLGRRIARGVTAGVFGGSTPDPTSWNYTPDQRIGGTFVNFEGGSFEHVHYSSTSGVAVNLLQWRSERQFLFFENTISYKRGLSLYHSLQADNPRGDAAAPSPGPGVSQSFLTARLAPVSRIEFTVNHNFFRSTPTFDPRLVGTGLLDRYLFEGMSAGVRVEALKQIFLYTDIGQSARSSDTKRSLNELYGITFGNVPWLHIRADGHYSRFDSSFGAGSYRAISLSRSFGDTLQWSVLAGDQTIASSLAGNQSARFLTTTLDTSLGTRFFLQGGFTAYRGQLQDYDQWYFTLGYRFDSKGHRQ